LVNTTRRRETCRRRRRRRSCAWYALRDAGYDWSHVVEATVFLPDISKAAEMELAYRSVFAKDPPIRTIMPTPLVGADALVEIMLTAVK
jgi:enamine deaminase RidA (YjgF/YER057c/UK114 family)